MSTVYLALDVHARHCVLGQMNDQGVMLNVVQFPTTEAELMRHVRAIQASRKLLTLEEGPMARWIAQTLHPHVDELLICNPHENHLISSGSRKNDRHDVQQLCRLLRLGELKQVYHPADDDRAVFKAAVQAYLDLVNQEVRIKGKIKAKFRAWGVVVTDTERIYHARHRDDYLKRLTQPAIRVQLQSLYDLLDAALHAKRAAFRQMIDLGQRYPEIALFRHVPGCGVVSAHVFSAWVQTPHRFANKRQLWRYAQLGIRERSSDGKPLGFKRLDREGNGALKQVSYWIGLGARRRRGANGLKTYHQASLERTHDKTHARLNTQRKALATLLAMWKHMEDYHDEPPTAATDSTPHTHAAVPSVTGL